MDDTISDTLILFYTAPVRLVGNLLSPPSISFLLPLVSTFPLTFPSPTSLLLLSNQRLTSYPLPWFLFPSHYSLHFHYLFSSPFLPLLALPTVSFPLIFSILLLHHSNPSFYDNFLLPWLFLIIQDVAISFFLYCSSIASVRKYFSLSTFFFFIWFSMEHFSNQLATYTYTYIYIWAFLKVLIFEV